MDQPLNAPERQKMQNDRQPETPERLLDSREAADFLHIGQRTLQRYVSPRGPLKCARIGRILRFRLEDLRQFVANNVQ